MAQSLFVGKDPSRDRRGRSVEVGRLSVSPRPLQRVQIPPSADRLDHGLRRLRHRHERAELETRLKRNRAALAENGTAPPPSPARAGRPTRLVNDCAGVRGTVVLTRQLSESAASVSVRQSTSPLDTCGPASGLHPTTPTTAPCGASARTVENYRLRWDGTDPERPLGEEPNHPLQQAEQCFAITALDRYQREGTRDRQLARPIAFGR